MVSSKHFSNLLKDVLALLGGLFTLLALVEPWITEQYHLLRLKVLITVVVVFLVFKLIQIFKNKLNRAFIILLPILGLTVFWIVIPTFPMNLLAWIPNPEEREFLSYDAEMSAIDAYKLGMINILNNNQDEANKAFRKALTDDKVKPYALDRLAFVERLQGNDSLSLSLYEKSLQYAKKAELKSERKRLLSYGWQNRGFLLRRFAHTFRNDSILYEQYQTKALQSFKYSIEHDSKFHKSWYMMGQIHYDRGELLAAKEAYYHAYFLNSQYDRAAYNLACIEADMGNNLNSLHWVKRTLQIDASQAYQLEEDGSFAKLQSNDVFQDLINDAKSRLEVEYRRRLNL